MTSTKTSKTNPTYDFNKNTTNGQHMMSIGMLCFIQGVLVVAKKWLQSCLGIECACNQ
jgi:hypothetical protein